MDESTKAYQLTGVTIPGGWLLKERYVKEKKDDRRQFSVQYLAEKDGKEYFVKVIYIEKALKGCDLTDMTKILEQQLAAFNYEKELLERCRDRSLSKIVRVIEASAIPSGELTVFPIPFLVFEKADGDVRKYIKFQDEVDFAWKLKSLHDIATGIEQLHTMQVIHQNLKPSKILQFKKDSKISDIGKSKTFTGTGFNDENLLNGDMAYAPLEMLPQFTFLRPTEWLDMNLATDSYELGNLMTFYFSGMNMTGMLIERLNKIGMTSRTTNMEMKAYLDICYDDCIETIKKEIEYEEFRDDIGQMIFELCNPDPNKRNDPKTLRERGSNFVLRRYITKLDLLQGKAELRIRKDGSIHR